MGRERWIHSDGYQGSLSDYRHTPDSALSYINLSVGQLLFVFVSKISWQPENWPRVGAQTEMFRFLDLDHSANCQWNNKCSAGLKTSVKTDYRTFFSLVKADFRAL